MKRIAALLVAAVLSGCASGTDFTWENAKKVQVGMSKDEVRGLMGKPYQVVSSSTTAGKTRWIWSHANLAGSQATSVDFLNDKVVRAPEVVE